MKFPVCLCAVSALACITPAQTRPEPPQLTVTVDDDIGRGPDCGSSFEPVRGPAPTNSRVLARLTVTASRPAPLEALEETLYVEALRRCASGLAIVRAEAADGEDGFWAAHGVAWVPDSP